MGFEESKQMKILCERAGILGGEGVRGGERSENGFWKPDRLGPSSDLGGLIRKKKA